MNKLLVNIITGFIPIKKWRHNLREIFKNNAFRKNKIILVKDNGIETLVKKIKGIKINIIGSGNEIRIPYKHHFKGSVSLHSSNTVIDIRSKEKLYLSISSCCGNNQKLSIGEETIVNGAKIFLNEENATVQIGKNCLFSGEINIWPTDGHSVLNTDSNKILNTIKRPLIIEDHCWIGTRTLLLKNTWIHKNSVLGGGSVACKDYKQENVVIAGNPGRIIKENVNWNHKNPFRMRKGQ